MFQAPLPPLLRAGASPDEWHARYRQVAEMVDEAELVDIGLPHDGATFNDPTPGAAADRLEDLKAMGYIVPQYAIDDLRTESAERCDDGGLS